MQIKPCPFCNTAPELAFDTASDLYKLECKHCQSSCIFLQCKGETLEKTIATWNNRWFDNQLILNKEEYQKFIDTYYYNQKILSDPNTRNLKEEVKLGVTGEKQANQDSYGYLIFDNNEIVECDLYGHPELIIKRFNLTDNPETFDHINYCIEHRIIRISIYNAYLSVDLPLQYSSKQIDAVFEALLNYKKTNEMTKFSLFYGKTKGFKVFYTLDEFLVALDEARNG